MITESSSLSIYGFSSCCIFVICTLDISQRRNGVLNMKYDVIIIGAGPGGIFTAYELVQQEKQFHFIFEIGI